MSFHSFRRFIKKVLYEDQNGPLPGSPDSPTSSIFVATELERLGFVFDYTCTPADQDTCFPVVTVYMAAHPVLPIERAIRLIRDSTPRQVRHQHGIITAWYGREPLDPDNSDHYRFFLGLDD